MKQLTVKELIEELKHFPEDWKVVLHLDETSLPEECVDNHYIRPGYYEVTSAYGFDEGEVGINIYW